MPIMTLEIPDSYDQLKEAYVVGRITVEEFEYWVWEWLNKRSIPWWRMGLPDPELVTFKARSSVVRAARS